MAVETAADLAVFFNSDEFGLAATYTPPGGGAAIPCIVLRDAQDRQASGTLGRPIMRGTMISVRKAEIAAPAKGGTFVVDGESLVIQGDPETDDADRLIWVCTVA
jgi:hypothetical protein